MKVIIVTLALVAVAAAASVPGEPDVIAIVRSTFDQKPEGGYEFAYETANGINRAEIGEVKKIVDDDKETHEVVVVRGSYGYTDVDGKPEVVEYYADETGYHATGDSIPQPPTRR